MKPISNRLSRALALPAWQGSTILLLLAAVSIVTMAAIPSSFAAGEADLLTALRAKGAQVLPLGSRGGLAGYFVTPAKGAGYSLYLTATGHAVAGLLYGPDGALITEDQLAAAGTANATVASCNRQRSDPGRAGPVASADADMQGDVSPITPKQQDAQLLKGRCELPVKSTGTPIAETTIAEPKSFDAAIGLLPPFPPSAADLFERSAAAFGFTLGERGPAIVLFGDARCPWSRSAAAKVGREAIAGRLRLRVVPVALLGAAAARRAAGIAASPDPAQAWFDRIDHPADRAGRDRIARNNALFDAWGVRSVPLIVWRGKDGGVSQRLGDIADIGVWLREAGLE